MNASQFISAQDTTILQALRDYAALPPWQACRVVSDNLSGPLLARIDTTRALVLSAAIYRRFFMFIPEGKG